MCFVWIWEQTAIISLYIINWLLFITEINASKPSGQYLYHQFNIQQSYVLPTQCIYVFCVDLRTNSDYLPVQHWLTGLYNRDGVCLLRGADWVFISNSVDAGLNNFLRPYLHSSFSPPSNYVQMFNFSPLLHTVIIPFPTTSLPFLHFPTTYLSSSLSLPKDERAMPGNFQSSTFSFL